MDQAEVDQADLHDPAEASDEESTPTPTPSQRKRQYKLENGVTMKVGY